VGLYGFDHHISLTRKSIRLSTSRETRFEVRPDDRLGDGVAEKSKTFWGIWGMEARRE